MQGLPIGNYTSQHFGNLYLNQFDWWMKQIIKPLGYFRYCDDILVMSNSTKELIDIKAKIVEKLKQLHLVIKSNWNIYNIYKNGVDFVGYVFKPDETRLRPTIVKKFKLKCVALRKIITKDNCLEYLSSLMSYKGWVKRVNGKQLWRKNTTQFIKIFPKQLRSAV
jgi:hypothetical protein